MPELPEVEAVVRTLRPLVQGRRIRCVHVFHPIATKPQVASHLARRALGRRIRIVDRKGKYVLLVLDRGLLTMHFRLDGQLLWFSSGKELLERANQGENGVHVDVALELDKGVLGFVDRRHFGRVHAWESAEDCPGLSVLGIDALSPDFTSRRFAQLVAASKRPLKDFLLDQSRVAGIGNIYSCESLWHARLDPRRRQHLETTGSAPLAQSNCVRSRPCLRMLSASGARLSRSRVVVPGVGKYSSRLRTRRKTLPPLRRADPAHCAGCPVNLLLRALSEISVSKGYGPIA
jgi:formamidopyrimidine-DNA glycosylase